MVNNATPLVPIDLTKPPEQLVIELINKDNGTSIKLGDLTFGVPELLPTGKHNSRVLATATPGSYYSGSVKINYNRIDISKIVRGRSTLFNIRNEKLLSELIPAIDERFELRLTPNDYIDTALPTFAANIPDEEKTVELVANPKSLVFIKSLKLTLERPAIDLTTLIKNILMNGLFYSAPAGQYLSL